MAFVNMAEISVTEIIFLAVTFTSFMMLLIWLLWWKYTDCYRTLYCPFNVPIFGSVLHMERDPDKLTKQFSDMAFEGNHYLIVLWLAWFPNIFGATAEICEAVLKSKEHIQKSYNYNFLHEWLGTGLLTSRGNKWNRRRKALTPAFHFAKLLNFVDTFEEKGDKFVQYLKEYAESGQPVDVQVPSSLMALESICKAAMGVDIDSLDSKCSEYVNAVRSMNSELQYRQRSPWLWPDLIYRMTKRGQTYTKNIHLLHDFTIKVINKRLSSYNSKEDNISTSNEIDNVYTSSEKTDFLQSLIELYRKDEIDLEGIREEVDTFMFEGHDTTAALVALCFFLLGNHQEYQKKLQVEIDNAKGDTILEKVQDMKYLDSVVKETLRLCPPVPLIGRHINEDCVINGIKIYKGTELMLAPSALHRNPSYWENPHEFNPDRFKSEEFLKRNPYCYVPFSAGPRNCIGQRYALLEAKIFIFKVLKSYSLKSLVADLRDIDITVEIILKAKSGLFVEFDHRK